MTRDGAQELIESLDGLLERERRAVTLGDLDEVSRLMQLKEALINHLSAIDGLQEERLERLRDKAIRNQVLLDNALQGIRSVADRIAELRKVRQGLDTYDRSGRKNRVPVDWNRAMERRA